MKISNFLMLKAIISLAFGVGFAVIPAVVWSIYGLTLVSIRPCTPQLFPT